MEIPEEGKKAEPHSNHHVLKTATLPPIIFEECFVKDGDPIFVDLVTKSTNELSEQKLIETYQVGAPQVLSEASVGVHLFVLVHGFQGN